MAGTNRMSGQNKVLVAAKTLIMLVLLVLYIVPFVMVLINSFKPNKVILKNPLSLPDGLFLDRGRFGIPEGLNRRGDPTVEMKRFEIH